MKKRISVLLMAFVVVGLIFAGCKKEEVVEEPTMAELILGTWNADLSASTVTMSFMGMTQTQTLNELMSSQTMTFNADGTVTTHEVYQNGSVDDLSATYTLADSVLTLTQDEQPVNFTIEELTKTSLKMTGDANMEIEGVSIPVTTHYELTR